MKIYFKKISLLILAIAGFFVSDAFACPKINGLLDANCDGKIQVAVFGDSIVRGIKDSGMNSETGGYLRYLSKAFPKVTFVNGGIPGIDSRSLFRAFKKNTPNHGKTYETLRASDVVLIGVGINDYWLDIPAQMTIRNILRTRDYVRAYSKSHFKVAPFTMTISLTNTNRGFQQPWVGQVNQLIYANRIRLGPIVPFSNLAARLIVSDDALHPDNLGYKRLSKIMSLSLKTSYNKLVLTRNFDEDKDGIADWAEIKKYFTDTKLNDSDGDTLLDGAEVFVYGTDPLNSDSDNDGVSDAEELANGTDPNLAYIVEPTATPVATPTPIQTPTATPTP